ncbi:LytS/YhcK type 5TM receptor domain-containing protein [uncultured Clostridium sp.]|uniref:LytS/YhcK type 5TM receptor domain-containing protein n=1 Tax=uncultured Clostridium sp. TaxID=59620 RepID=UPI0028EA05BE|nr:LytS/YhcK type 5TM receptor domain-containing protein [uncultured Clostridium sp.]
MLYIQLLQNMSLIALSSYIFNQIALSKKLLIKDSKWNKIIIIIFFSILSILGTYTGIDVNPKINPPSLNFASKYPYALANTRPIGAITAGYIGGPLVGVIVGSIAGLQRYYIGGFTALACGVSTIVEGLCGGIAHKLSKKKDLDPKLGFIVGVIAEILQMIIILILSRPFKEALELEKIIALPMILINSIGVVIFINITNNALEQYNRISAYQSEKALLIAEKTLNYLKKGFNKETSEKVCKIIYDSSNYNGVFIANSYEILSYHGGDLNLDMLNSLLKDYYKAPDYKPLPLKEEGIEKTLFFIPIFHQEKLEVTIGLYLKSEKYIDEYFMQFTKQLGRLLSTQLNIYKLNKAVEEAYRAEYKALRAQIHPHFLFNALNTISSFCRTNPSKARELILDLSNYFRSTLKRDEEFLTLKEEVEFLNSYLSIENARFGDRLKVNIDIPSNFSDYKIPAFILQPLIENSIKHGILPKPSGGNIDVKVICRDEKLCFLIKDDGVGIEENVLKNIFNNSRIGLYNVNERLKLLYGENYHINVKSAVGEGTEVSFVVPKEVRLN